MLPAPPKPRDPLTMAFLAVVAVLLVIGAVLGLRALFSAPTPAQRANTTQTTQPASGLSLSALSQSVRRAADEFMTRFSPVAPAKAPPVVSAPPAQKGVVPRPAAPGTGASDPQRAYRRIAAPAPPHVLAVPANAAWTYDVFFGPAWQKTGQLHYETIKSAEGRLSASMAWTPNGGKTTTWLLGVVEADHASHANTRFPGFFMHPAYFPQTLAPGARLLWEFPWQGGDARRQAERVRRYDMKVIAWERLAVPAGEFDAVRLEGKLLYVESDSVKADVAYTLWYAPRAKQIVRLRWIGRGPDEGGAEMIAELASYRGP